MDLLIKIAKDTNKTTKHKDFNGSWKIVLDVETVASMILKNFIEGKLGKIMLDNDLLFKNEEANKELEKFV